MLDVGLLDRRAHSHLPPRRIAALRAVLGIPPRPLPDPTASNQKHRRDNGGWASSGSLHPCHVPIVSSHISW